MSGCGNCMMRFERLAAILRNAGMISTEAASEIADMDLRSFIEKYGMRLEADE